MSLLLYMDAMVVQLDTVDASGPWRRIIHAGDAGNGISVTAATAAAAAAAARLSQSILGQGIGGNGQQRMTSLLLKTDNSGPVVERPSSSRSGADPSGSGEKSPSALQAPLSSNIQQPSPPSTPLISSSIIDHALESGSRRSSSPRFPVSTPAGPPQTSGIAPTRPSPSTDPSTDSVFPAAERGIDSLLPKPHTPAVATPTTSDNYLPTPRTSLKRSRPETDVDGPMTSTLSCKKRRLLRNLVTSPLSRRFSLPATHVPNLECSLSLAGSGGMEKRFLKLAAAAAARRLASAPGPSAGAQLQLRHHHQQQPPASELLRRAAIINRFRLRVYVEAAERGDAGVAELAASAALFHSSPRVRNVVTGSNLARFPGYSGSGARPAADLMPPPPRPPPQYSPSMSSPAAQPSSTVHTTSFPAQSVIRTPSIGPPAAANQAQPQQPPVQSSQPSSARNQPTPFTLPPTIVAPRPLFRAAVVARRSASPGMTPPGSPSKGLRPADAVPTSAGSSTGLMTAAATRLPSVSPRLRPLSVEDDEGVAFPTSEFESRYESGDESSDDMYADFGVIFGGGAGGDGTESDDGMGGSDVDAYEEFMDDLDGIPWSAR